jgi:uncharacterized protein YegP (UPF0339 family)
LRAFDTARAPERKIAFSETYRQRASARNAADLIVVGEYRYQTFLGSDRKWYWRLRGLNNEKVVRSSASYPSEKDAGWREDWLARHGASAIVVDNT